MGDDNLDNWVRERIERLRPKLLDLTKKNPLLSTKLNPRTNSYVRVVDELPDVLAYNLATQRAMRFAALPPLEADPVDELTSEFRSAFAEAQRTDDEYIAAIEALHSTDPDIEDKTRILDRGLKDKLREKFGMRPREIAGDISLANHARLHGVAPEYELPLPNDEHDDGRHTDDAIQTLLLPDQMERKLTALTTKCNTWIQETGINVLHGAYGFLEWNDGKSDKAAMAPLVLMQVGISKNRTPDGPEFWIKGLGETAETNLVLSELLKREYDINLPAYEDGSIEEYLSEVAELNPKNLKIKVRRQVAFGVFPSARMAMYHDLNPDKTAIHQSPIVSQLLGGSEAGEASPFADEYDVEAPEIEKKIPCLVTEADSSQLSVLVDLADGRSLAVEGPPGTGKSQTIVNAIASAIAGGKKVLFVAEKMAALEVVKSRLEALGLGEFVLPLQAERSTREQVISSIRDRITMATPHAPRDYDEKLSEYRRLRSNLNAYVDTVSSDFGNTGLTVYEALGKAIQTNDLLQGRDDVFVRAPIIAVENITRSQLDQALEAAQIVDDAMTELAELPDSWSGIAPKRYDKIELDQIRALASEAAERFQNAHVNRKVLSAWDVPEDANTSAIKAAISLLDDLQVGDTTYSKTMFAALCALDDLSGIFDFASHCDLFQKARANLEKIIKDPDDQSTIDALRELRHIAATGNYATLDPNWLRSEVAAIRQTIDKLARIKASIEPLTSSTPGLHDYDIGALRDAHILISQITPDILRLRSAENSASKALEPLKVACEEGARLRSIRAEIEELVRIPTDIPPSQIYTNARALQNGGFFSFLSSDVRRAKKLVRSLAKGKLPKAKEAGVLLQSIAEWKEQCMGFDTPARKEVFGIHYSGVDTDFDKFGRLANFYDVIDSKLRGAQNRALRKLLKEADTESLLELPEIEPVDWEGTVGNLRSDLSSMEDKAKRISQDIFRLEALVHKFVDLPSVAVDSLENLIDLLVKTLDLKKKADADLTGKAVLGDAFAGAFSDTALLRWHLELISKTQAVSDISSSLQIAISGGSTKAMNEALKEVVQADTNASAALEKLKDRCGKDFANLRSARLQRDRAKLLEDAARDERGISANTNLARAYKNLQEMGYDWVPSARSLGTQNITGLLRAAIYRAMATKIMERYGAILNKFPGAALNEMRAKLANLDKEILLLSRKQLRALAVANAKPLMGNGTGPKSGWTQLSLLQNEIAKQKRFVSVRDLTERAGKSLQELKPCWMMSPLAVAQYLPAQNLRFDLCVIDEASQMKPEDALGALARADQAMVVGDVNQLPPSNFFQKMVADDEDDELGATVEEESILEISNAKLRPSRRLRWHYRSQHSGLIRFSNEVIYQSTLVIFPSSDEQRPDMGVSLVPVNGLYHNSVNPIEAKAVVEAALRSMRQRPDVSLGIVTLNQKQRDLIIDEMGYALEQDEAAAIYVEDWNKRNDGLEKFFIKNLENVQGDERDVIFIGTVYGPDRDGGKTAQRFGPINGAAGRRRLNVLFSRAKKQIVTFSSLKPSDITANEESNPGTNMLKRWLEFSASNVLEQQEGPYAETDSDFEDYVIEQIRSIGCEAVPQVGCAGYRIDIGVKHPDWPYGFILAVECDGATYHSCRSARDRDRLRQEVLERLGWHFHRIWSTDWFNDPRAETARLRAAIERRLEELKAQPREALDFSQVLAAEPSESKDQQTSASPPELFDTLQDNVSETSSASEPLKPDFPVSYIEVGDTIRVRYLTGSKASIQVTITEQQTNPGKGIIAAYEPLAEALLGAESGDEIEVLIGSYVRKALVENIIKAA